MKARLLAATGLYDFGNPGAAIGAQGGTDGLLSKAKPGAGHLALGSRYAFTSGEYQRFLQDHQIICSMSEVDHCGDNAAAEGFLGKLKRERINRRKYLTRAGARSDVFDYIKRFHNPWIQRRLDGQDRKFSVLTQLSAETG